MHRLISLRIIQPLQLSLAFLCLQTESFAQSPQTAELPAIKQEWRIDQIQSPVQILVDTWGVPHIYAENEADLFFAQGFNAARDRLFQLDLWRRRGLGQLAEAFGSSYLEQDRAARLFLYRGDMQKEWNSYGKQAATLTQHFVAGINAYIDYVNANPERLPNEFKILKYRPAKWLATDVVRIRSHGLTRNLNSEVARARMACSGDLELDEVRQRLAPAWKTKIPAGLSPCLPNEVLRQFTLATQNVSFDGLNSRLNAAIESSVSTTDNLLSQAWLEKNTEIDSLEGSNNWVLAPSKTSTGRAIMANDPHRAYSAPSLRYIAHLNAPGINVIGAGEPALPGISIGHNGSIAFGLTIMSIDQEDLYVYEMNPRNPMQYKYRGKWENLQTQKELFLVKNQAEQSSELLFTRHGPLIYQDKLNNRAYAVRTAWLEPGMAPYFGSVDYMRAKNFSQFKKAMLHWGAPTENQVYADTKGNIGWVPGGLTPIRPNWDGLLPVPGDGRFEWAGFLSGDKLPYSYNPKSAWFASANELNLPASYPYQLRKLGFEWPHDARYQRIASVLSQSKKFSIEDSLQLQNDIVSLPATRLVKLLMSLHSTDETANKALALFKTWNYVESTDSAAAGLFQVWLTQTLAPAYKDLMLGTRAHLVNSMPDMTRMLDNLDRSSAFPRQFGNTLQQAQKTRDQLLLNSLSLAYQRMEHLLGKNSQEWRWGNIQKTEFTHPLSKLLDATQRAQFDIGPLPRGGSANTVNQSTYRLSDFVQINGPTFRVVVDVGNWDNSRAINAPGQSGDQDSPHYRDLTEKWSKGQYFPLLYSRSAIENNTKQSFLLTPKK
ncbi:penicillin acylase family protein [Undibacterium fentianense]|uniref:Penicillin acylase family protein n=1 Tax=Undibacterium fentianense TaxID=2828728 RepID=A0A941E0H2_9BURK|nr:penicillin acylase family protein [Undibacterium fentianense]MBR7799086.1 penicillin acylase family protein [Undibacterium fentianense]